MAYFVVERKDLVDLKFDEEELVAYYFEAVEYIVEFLQVVVDKRHSFEEEEVDCIVVVVRKLEDLKSCEEVEVKERCSFLGRIVEVVGSRCHSFVEQQVEDLQQNERETMANKTLEIENKRFFYLRRRSA